MFRSLLHSEKLLGLLRRQQITEATPIQRQAIPAINSGKDVLAQAPTGTGKTLAYLLPLLERLAKEDKEPLACPKTCQVLILAPTRELALQIFAESRRYGEALGLRSACLYGGVGLGKQRKQLQQGARLVIGTPGRVLDLLRRGTLDCRALRALVLDEADEMLVMGFITELRAIFTYLPKQRQNLLFSATLEGNVQVLGEQLLKQAHVIQIGGAALTAEAIQQYYMKLHEREKFTALTRLLDVDRPKRALIFARTKQRVDELGRALIEAGYPAESLHGDLTQSRRLLLLRQFKKGEITILVASDVAARGLDISEVNCVYNYDIPDQVENYVHRVGRTGRAGSVGRSVTFVGLGDEGLLREIEAYINMALQPLAPKTEREAMDSQMARISSEVALAKEARDVYQARAVEQLVATYDPHDLALALIQQGLRGHRREQIVISDHQWRPNRPTRPKMHKQRQDQSEAKRPKSVKSARKDKKCQEKRLKRSGQTKSKRTKSNNKRGRRQ